jgi:hypothetical protein
MSPSNLEELKALLGDEGLPEKESELDWVKRNRTALLRQWEYVRTLL